MHAAAFEFRRRLLLVQTVDEAAMRDVTTDVPAVAIFSPPTGESAPLIHSGNLTFSTFMPLLQKAALPLPRGANDSALYAKFANFKIKRKVLLYLWILAFTRAVRCRAAAGF